MIFSLIFLIYIYISIYYLLISFKWWLFFFCYAFKFKEFFWFIYNFFFLSFVWMNFIFEKKNIFSDNISNICILAWCFSPLLFYSIKLICVSIFNVVCLNKKNILINKFSKYNKINFLFFKIKYLDLLIFQVLFLGINLTVGK